MLSFQWGLIANIADSHLQTFRCLDGEGNGNPLLYSRLENPMAGGAWWAAVHGVTKSRKWLSDFIFTFHFHALEKEMATHSCSCLENPRDGGAWWAAIYGVTQSQTWLERLSSRRWLDALFLNLPSLSPQIRFISFLLVLKSVSLSSISSQSIPAIIFWTLFYQQMKLTFPPFLAPSVQYLSIKKKNQNKIHRHWIFLQLILLLQIYQKMSLLLMPSHKKLGKWRIRWQYLAHIMSWRPSQVVAIVDWQIWEGNVGLEQCSWTPVLR